METGHWVIRVIFVERVADNMQVATWSILFKSALRSNVWHMLDTGGNLSSPTPTLEVLDILWSDASKCIFNAYSCLRWGEPHQQFPAVME